MSLRNRFEGFLWRMLGVQFVPSASVGAANQLRVLDSGEIAFNGQVLGARLPVGAVMPWPGVTPIPANAVLCDGQAISRTEYADLFALIGVTYGVGDGATTFNVPDLTGRMPIPDDGGTEVTFATPGGADTHTHTVSGTALSTAQLPSHDHSKSPTQFTPGTNSGSPFTRSTATGNQGSGNAHTHGITDATNFPPYVTHNFVIYT